MPTLLRRKGIREVRAKIRNIIIHCVTKCGAIVMQRRMFMPIIYIDSILQELTEYSTTVDKNMQMLKSDTTWLQLLSIVKTYHWIFGVVIALICIHIFITIIRMSHQKKTENSITNLFNKDGSRNEHFGHRTYHIVTPLFSGLVVAFIWYIIYTI